jgi:hypothetical protein
MSAESIVDQIEAERNYYRDRVALMRAKLYRQGRISTPRLQELERGLERAELRLAKARSSRSA